MTTILDFTAQLILSLAVGYSFGIAFAKVLLKDSKK